MTMYKGIHRSVMLKECIEYLDIKENGLYLDCNLGAGGHTAEILKHGGKVIALDVDQDAIDSCTLKFEEQISQLRLKILHRNFREVDSVISDLSLNIPAFDGILYDLGLSMDQLKDSQKGFSFNDDKPLDMRMDSNLTVTAEDIIRLASVDQLSEIIKDYGEEPNHKKYAFEIKRLFDRNQTVTAKQISERIELINGTSRGKIHPATKLFQALRIIVNSELDNLNESLNKVIPLIKTTGRLVILTFHSLEEDVVKKATVSPYLKRLNKNPIRPDIDEIKENSASRSAKLNAYEKLK